MRSEYVVLGSNGFVGDGVVKQLVTQDVLLKCVDIVEPMERINNNKVEYYIGDIYDEAFLSRILKGTDTVLNFIATTMPSSTNITLEQEIYSTLKLQNYILEKMVINGVKRYVFPSSGGAIYGDKISGVAFEDEPLFPKTPYGVGKQMSEDIIRYYANKCGITAYIFRIGNVYGSPQYRNKAQGVIDIFIQNALAGDEISIWASAENSVRDYIYMEDVAQAICMTLMNGKEGYNVYNVGTGRGTNLLEIISIIEDRIGKKLKTIKRSDFTSEINAIVLSNEKIKNEIGWEPRVSLEDGIARTISYKKKLGSD